MPVHMCTYVRSMPVFCRGMPAVTVCGSGDDFVHPVFCPGRCRPEAQQGQDDAQQGCRGGGGRASWESVLGAPARSARAKGGSARVTARIPRGRFERGARRNLEQMMAADFFKSALSG